MKAKKTIIFLLMVVLLSAGLSAGGGGDRSTPADGKYDIEIMSNSSTGGGWPDDFIMIQRLNEKLNINLKFIWNPSGTYDEKINVLAASRSFPDSYLVLTREFTSWQNTGIFMDLKPVINNYKNLTTYLDPAGYELFCPPGKYYGIPFYQIESRDSFFIRIDWLEKLGLQIPDTVEDFLNVTKAFALNDPDGNGRADTIGFSAPLRVNDEMTYLSGAFGVPNGWKLDGGKLVPWQTCINEMKAFLSFMNRMYAEDALDKDFALISNQIAQEKFVGGKAGVHDNNLMNLATIIRPPLEQNDPNARIAAILPPKGPTGLRATRTQAISSKLVINSSIPAGKQTRILELYDYMLSDEGYDALKNGYEGIHYQRNSDGTFTKLPRFDDDRPFILSTWLIRRTDPLIQIRKWDSPELANEISTAINNASNYVLRNPAHGLISATDLRVGNNINERLQEIMARIIVGELNVNAYDNAAADWLRGGGEAIINEINAEYAKLNQ